MLSILNCTMELEQSFFGLNICVWHKMIRRGKSPSLTPKVLNFWKFTSYCSLKPLWSGMGEVVPARTSPTLHPPSPPTVHQLSQLALLRVNECDQLQITAIHMNVWEGESRHCPYYLYQSMDWVLLGYGISNLTFKWKCLWNSTEHELVSAKEFYKISQCILKVWAISTC